MSKTIRRQKTYKPKKPKTPPPKLGQFNTGNASY
jgi:hypothetical protein